jgi:hypothetical protein
MMSMHVINAGIVNDGQRRAAAGAADELERRIQQIERRYKQLKARAPWAGRWVIMHRMRWRIRRARERFAPSWGLYAMSTRRFAPRKDSQRRRDAWA